MSQARAQMAPLGDPARLSSEEAALRELLPRAPAILRIVAAYRWFTYEEGGAHWLIAIDERLYAVGHDSSVYSSEGPIWSPVPLSEDEALEIMVRWEQNEVANGLDETGIQCSFELM